MEQVFWVQGKSSHWDPVHANSVLADVPSQQQQQQGSNTYGNGQGKSELATGPTTPGAATSGAAGWWRKSRISWIIFIVEEGPMLAAVCSIVRPCCNTAFRTVIPKTLTLVYMFLFAIISSSWMSWSVFADMSNIWSE